MQSYLPALAILGKAGGFFWTLFREYQLYNHCIHKSVSLSCIQLFLPIYRI
jgi:hypothetical protein